MTINESKIKDGTLTLGTTPTTIDFSCQVTNVRINSTYDDDGDAQETLCGDVLTPGRKLGGRSLAGTVIQDFTAATSIIEFLWDHDLEVMAFEYVPHAEAPTITGSVLLEVPGESYGGDVNARLTSDFEWQITDTVVFTPPVMAMTASEGMTQTSGEIRVEGINELVRTLRKAGVDIQDLKDAHTRAGDIVVTEANMRAPRQSGRLAGTIKSAKQAKRARVQAGRANVPYAGAIHWGWPARNIEPQPFLADAAVATEPTWTARYVEDVQAALDKVKGA